MFLVSMNILIAICGFILGFIVREKMEGSSFLEYFGTPSDKRLDLDWFGRQFFYLFSKAAGERWYESRAHLYRGVFISLLAAFGLIYIVRVEYGTSDDCRFSCSTFITHGFQSKKTMKTKIPQWIDEYKAKSKDAQYYHQTFISGFNVVDDFMSSY